MIASTEPSGVENLAADDIEADSVQISFDEPTDNADCVERYIVCWGDDGVSGKLYKTNLCKRLVKHPAR